MSHEKRGKKVLGCPTHTSNVMPFEIIGFLFYDFSLETNETLKTYRIHN